MLMESVVPEALKLIWQPYTLVTTNDVVFCVIAVVTVKENSGTVSKLIPSLVERTSITRSSVVPPKLASIRQWTPSYCERSINSLFCPTSVTEAAEPPSRNELELIGLSNILCTVATYSF